MTQIGISGATISLCKTYLTPDSADRLFEQLVHSVPWRQDTIKMFGKVHNVPRLQQWYGDAGLSYTWSGIRMQPIEWTPCLTRIRDDLERQNGTLFNTVLINMYRDGKDTVGWHSDNEPELGDTPDIASLSLGSSRDFVLRRGGFTSHKLALTHGSLLVMSGDTQKNWEHSVPRRARIKTPRINLTFRQIK